VSSAFNSLFGLSGYPNIFFKVLVVDPERKRVSLTAKKTLVDSTLPVVSSIEDAKVGTVVHAVVFKVLAKSLMVEFFNNVKAVVPIKEVRSVMFLWYIHEAKYNAVRNRFKIYPSFTR